MTTEPDQLPCGAELEALVIQVTDDKQPIDLAHQNSCPYCQTALRSLRQGWADVQALTREPVPFPPRLTAQLMARVRALARHVTDAILLGHPRGQTHISHTVIGQVIQRIASSVPGVVFATAKPIPHDPPNPPASASTSDSSWPSVPPSTRSPTLFATSSTDACPASPAPN